MINAAVKKYNMLSEGQGRLRYGIVSKLLDSATNKKKKQNKKWFEENRLHKDDMKTSEIHQESIFFPFLYFN